MLSDKVNSFQLKQLTQHIECLLASKLTELEGKTNERLDAFNIVLLDCSQAKAAVRQDIANEVQKSCDKRIDQRMQKFEKVAQQFTQFFN